MKRKFELTFEPPEVDSIRRSAVLVGKQQAVQGMVVGFVVASALFAPWLWLLAAVVVGQVVLQWNTRRRP